MNKSLIMGRICKDLEIRKSQSDMSILKFTVAVNRMKKGEADFINCLAFDKTADNIFNFFGKGKMICIEGHIQTGSYDNDKGQKVYTTEVVVDKFHFTGEKKDESTTQIGYTDVTDSISDELPF